MLAVEELTSRILWHCQKTVLFEFTFVVDIKAVRLLLEFLLAFKRGGF